MLQARLSGGAARALYLAAALALLGACRFDAPYPPLYAGDEARQALDTLKAKIGHPVRALDIEISNDELAVELQDPAQPTHVDKWTLVHVNHQLAAGLSFSWEEVSGPAPVELDLINPRLEENLFDLDEVNIAATAKLGVAAVKRVALEDPAAVVGMRIERQLTLIPAPHSGEVTWTVEVRSARERAEAIADAKGNVRRLDLDGTNRAKRLDMLAGGKPLEEAIADIRELWGEKPSIETLRFATGYLWFLARDLEDAKKERWYNANLNGITASPREPLEAGRKAAGMPANELFAVGEVDWSLLVKLEAAARQRLEMPGGALYAVEVSKPAREFGTSTMQWEITVEDRGEKGTVDFDGKGEVKRVRLPESKRPPLNLLEGPAMAEALAAVRGSLGAHAKLMELDFRDSMLLVTAQDPKKPAALGLFSYDAGELKRSAGGAATALWHGYGDDWFFEADELDDAVLGRLPELTAETLARLKIAGGKVDRITFSRNKVFDPASTALQIVIRVEGDDRKGGWVAYGLAGNVLHVMTP